MVIYNVIWYDRYIYIEDVVVCNLIDSEIYCQLKIVEFLGILRYVALHSGYIEIHFISRLYSW